MSYTIVSFCGGGIRGVMSATILGRLAEKRPEVLTNTNLLAGTSTGATIIGSLIAGLTPADIVTNYLKGGVDFYKNHYNADWQSPAYPVDLLAIGYRELFKTKFPGGAPQLAELTQSVLFTSFNVAPSGEPPCWSPILFTNLPPASPTANTSIVDAVVSSSAMPGMFGSLGGHVDGAFVHHDPTLAAIALAVSQGHSLSDMFAIGIGTGFMPNYLVSDTSKWGAEQWQHGAGKPEDHVPALLINGKKAPILNISLSGTSTNLIPQLCAMLLPPGHYIQLNPTLKKFIPENTTDQKELDYLVNMGAHAPIGDAVKMIHENWSKA